jgi:hypothetical protein
VQTWLIRYHADGTFIGEGGNALSWPASGQDWSDPNCQGGRTCTTVESQLSPDPHPIPVAATPLPSYVRRDGSRSKQCQRTEPVDLRPQAHRVPR